MAKKAKAGQKKLTFREYLHQIGPFGIIVRIFLLWFVIALLLYPNLNLIKQIFFEDGQFSTAVFHKVFSSTRAMRALKNSFILAFTLVVTVNVVGTLLVLFTEYFDIKGAKILRYGYMTTLIYGGIVLCTGYKFIYGSNGIITNFLASFITDFNKNWFVGYPAVVFIMTFACTSNHIIFLTNALRGIDNQMIEAAQNMGETPGRIFWKIVMPILKPNLFAITIMTFLTGLGAVSAPLVVGGKSFQTINPIIIDFAKIPTSREIAALLAILLGLATTVLLLIMNRIEKGGTYMSIAKTKTRLKKQKIHNPVLNALAHILAWLLWLIYVVPIVLVIIYSFTSSANIQSAKLSLDAFTLENWISFFTKRNAARPFIISITYSGLAAIIGAAIVVVAVQIIKKGRTWADRALEYVMLVPWLLPSTLIALGLMMAYDVQNPLMFNQVLLGTPIILLFGYIIIKIPFSLRMIKAAFYSVSDDMEEASKCMGAGEGYTLRKVVLPVVLPSVISVMVLNFNSLLSDYDLTVFLYHPLLEPLGIVIKAATDETATLNAVAMSFVYAVVLMVISGIAVYFTMGDRDKGGMSAGS